MSLLKDLLKETATGGVTSAGAIAGVRGGIGGNSSKAKKKKKNEKKVRARLAPVGTFSALRLVHEADSTFDPSDVLAKMRSAGDQAENGTDTKTFALEDEDGNLVKVSVAAEEAEDFEDALARALHGDEDDGDNSVDDPTSKEIAEILFDLKDKFTIIDVSWPEIEEDEEEDATAANDETMGDVEGDAEGDLGDAEGDLGDEDMEGDMGDEEGDMTAGGDENADQMSALSQVIDLLKAQQDAQRAEAEAKTAEAQAKKAEAESVAAMAKVRQEEQLLDMEAYYKQKKNADKETKRLAQLARWKHDQVADADMDRATDEIDININKTVDKNVTSEEEEEQVNVYDTKKIDQNGDGKLEPKEFIRYLFKYLRDR